MQTGRGIVDSEVIRHQPSWTWDKNPECSWTDQQSVQRPNHAKATKASMSLLNISSAAVALSGRRCQARHTYKKLPIKHWNAGVVCHLLYLQPVIHPTDLSAKRIGRSVIQTPSPRLPCDQCELVPVVHHSPNVVHEAAIIIVRMAEAEMWSLRRKGH